MSGFTAVPMTEDKNTPYTGPIGWSPPQQQQPATEGGQPSGLDNLTILQPYNEFILQPVSGSTIYAAQILDGNGQLLFNVDRQQRRSRMRRGMGGASMNLLTTAGQILFNCDLEEYEATVTGPGGIPMAEVYNSAFIRNFVVTKANGSKIDVVPTGAMSGSVWCAFNACLMNEYSIESNGNVLGTIRCAPKGSTEGHKIRFESQVDVHSKALALATTLAINELYFSTQNCFGNVGLVGRNRIVLFLCLSMLIPAGIMAYFFEHTRSKG